MKYLLLCLCLFSSLHSFGQFGNYGEYVGKNQKVKALYANYESLENNFTAVVTGENKDATFRNFDADVQNLLDASKAPKKYRNKIIVEKENIKDRMVRYIQLRAIKKEMDESKKRIEQLEAGKKQKEAELEKVKR
jgi:prophage tail gpP-like protein